MTLDLDELERIGKEARKTFWLVPGTIVKAMDNWQPMIDELRTMKAVHEQLDRIIEGQSKTIDTLRAENEKLRKLKELALPIPGAIDAARQIVSQGFAVGGNPDPEWLRLMHESVESRTIEVAEIIQQAIDAAVQQATRNETQ